MVGNLLATPIGFTTNKKMSLESSFKFSRRRAIQLSLLAGGSSLLSNAFSMSPHEEFDFIAVNDLHYHDADCHPWFTKVFEAMRKSAPQAEFILLGGDLADEGKPEQLSGFHHLLPKLGMPWQAVPGNHDCENSTSWNTYETLFPGQRNSVFMHRGWQFIGLDSTEGDKWHDTTIATSTINYLETILSKVSKDTPLVIFTHFPMGENIIFPSQKPDAPTYNFRPVNAAKVLEKLEGFNLQAVFSGHFHSFTERTFQGATLTTDKCCSRVQKNHDGTPEKGWFVCRASNGKITRHFVEIPTFLR